MLVLSAQGKIDFPVHLFCNVGDDSENPATLKYVQKWSQPYAEAHGIELVTLHKTKRDGTPVTLMENLTRNESRSIPIPVRMSNGAPGNRSCTFDYKIALMSKWLKANGATKDNPALVGIGISVDEIERANRGKGAPVQDRTYPLLDLGLNRNNCHTIIADAGLPTPPKSSCFFCPFHRPQVWAEMARDEPELFEKSAALEDLLNERRDMLGKDHVYLTRFNKPLREAIGPAQDQLFTYDSGMDDGECDEGVCFV